MIQLWEELATVPLFFYTKVYIPISFTNSPDGEPPGDFLFTESQALLLFAVPLPSVRRFFLQASPQISVSPSGSVW